MASWQLLGELQPRQVHDVVKLRPSQMKIVARVQTEHVALPLFPAPFPGSCRMS